MKVIPVEKEKFITIIQNLNPKNKIDVDYLFEIYTTACEAIEEVSNLSELANFTPVNHLVLIMYILNEVFYFTSSTKNFDYNNDDLFNLIASICTDKYLTNEQLNYKSGSFLNRFNPAISTLDLYSNLVIKIIDVNRSFNQADKLVRDLLVKAFKMIKCITNLLVEGFETEAFSTWRTLHENECILICLLKYPKELFPAYFKHVTYALAYRNQLKTVEETDKVFEIIKSEMKNFDLKSKDMKKFIEYGYLLAIPNLKLNQDVKLNFRDGVEKIAGLSSYSKVYETASEIAHSSPLLLYSRRDYFFNLTILNLYESFFRLENAFYSFYRNFCSEEEHKKYIQLRTVYLAQTKSIYGGIKQVFIDNFLVKDSRHDN